MVTERIKFYADTKEQKNKFFCFKINSIMDLQPRMMYWMKKVYIRSAWYECIENDVVISNDKIDLTQLVDGGEPRFITK